jgi:hypothetical protein
MRIRMCPTFITVTVTAFYLKHAGTRVGGGRSTGQGARICQHAMQPLEKLQ